jgi:hypothetical protein
MRQRFRRFLWHARRGAAAEDVGELAEGREQVDETKTRNGAANEVVRQQHAQRRHCLDKVVAVPEGGPRNQNEQKPSLEQQGDEQQTSEQKGLPFCLHFRQAIDPACDIAIAAGFGFELDEKGQGPGMLAHLFERVR